MDGISMKQGCQQAACFNLKVPLFYPYFSATNPQKHKVSAGFLYLCVMPDFSFRRLVMPNAARILMPARFWAF